SIKTNFEHVHFVFVTGITRFAMASLDSGANNFKDISIDKKYAGICGFTSREIIALFGDRFEATLEDMKAKGKFQPNAGVDELKAKIIDWYDGYSWLGNERVFNPYSILNFFDEMNFRSYWPLTGRPSHLSALVRENPLEFLRPDHDAYPDLQVRNAELSGIGMVPVMFHSGYLTINEEISSPNLEDETAYTFKPPNREVGANARADIFKDIFKIEDKYLNALTEKFPSAVLQKNSAELASLFHDLLVSISYILHPKATQTGQPDASLEKPESENFYHGILHGSLLSAGFKVQSEVPGGEGRPDITLFLHNDVCVVIELKHRRVGKIPYSGGWDGETDRRLAETAAKDNELSAALDAAEAQIRNMDYAGPYRAAGYKVICLAVAVRGRTEVAARFVET
ncbi:MAG: ATP-binding protein, partial [Deltaproteobacteria bacterium]|nr:ATP-binding protein [Deltaproteobacteria bacterium]